MNQSTNLKLQQAIKFEGILAKENPGIFHSYQKKYYKFLDNGLTLAFADSKEDFAKNKIIGQIALKDILHIMPDEQPKRFQMIGEGKVYKFEAGSPEERKKWVDNIKLCMQYADMFEAKMQEQMKSIDEGITYEKDDKNEEDQMSVSRRSTNFNPFGAVVGAMGKVVAGTVGTAKDNIGNIVNKMGNAIIEAKPRSNEEYLEAKKLNVILDAIDPKILKSRLMMGYLLKETKEATGLKLVDDLMHDSRLKDAIARRWCLLVSSKPIIYEQVDPEDEEVLDTGKLPFDIEPEVLYIYDDSCDDSKPLESILLKDVVDVVVRKKVADEQVYRFLLDVGGRKINLMSSNIIDMTQWIKSIQVARANLKEKSKSKLASIKNMYWHFKVMHDQGEIKLIEKINGEYEKLTAASEDMGSDNVKEMIKMQEKVANEFLAVVNACLAHKDQRIDVIKLYVDAFHENMINALRSFFKKHQENIENRDIFEIIKFLIWYRERLRIFGDAFVDQRMLDGTETLCKIVARRILKTNMKTIKNIVLQELEKEPEIDGRGRAATNTPNDVFKIANESFNVMSFCNTKELSLALLEACSNTLEYFSNGLAFIIENYDLSIDHLAAFCNNTLTYMSNVKEFGKQAEQLTGADKETISVYFNEPAFNKVFIAQGKRSYEKLADMVFGPLCDEWSKVPFLSINVQKSVSEYIDKINAIMEKVHGNFTTKIEAACLEKVVTYYIQSFLISAEKKRFKSDDVSKITGKFEDDTGILADLFNNIKKSIMESYVKPINNFHEFFTSNYAFLSMSVQSLKEQYGNAIKWQTIDLMMKLRNDTIDKEEKIELFKTCEQVYKTTQKKVEQGKNFNPFKHVDQNFEGENKVKRSITTTSFIDDDNLSDSGSRSSRTSSASSRSGQNMEGYLEADINEFLSNVSGGSLLSNLKFEMKYFNLRRDMLYYYKERNSETALGAFKIKDMVDSGNYDSDNTMFFITLKQSTGENKTIRFKASKPDKRDQWLEAIRDARDLPDLGAMVELNAAEIQLFKDTNPMFNEIETQPDLTFWIEKKVKENKASVATNATDTEEGRRKKSFDINDIPESVPVPKDQGGCMTKFCKIFGK